MSTSGWGCQDDVSTTDRAAYKKRDGVRPGLFKPYIQDIFSDPVPVGECSGRGFELLGVSSEEDDRRALVQKPLRDGETDAP